MWWSCKFARSRSFSKSECEATGADGGPEGAAGQDRKPCPGVLQSQLYEEEQYREKLPKENKNENIWEIESK